METIMNLIRDKIAETEIKYPACRFLGPKIAKYRDTSKISVELSMAMGVPSLSTTDATVSLRVSFDFELDYIPSKDYAPLIQTLFDKLWNLLQRFPSS